MSQTIWFGILSLAGSRFIRKWTSSPIPKESGDVVGMPKSMNVVGMKMGKFINMGDEKGHKNFR